MSDKEKQSLRKQVEVLQTKITSLELSNKDLRKQIEDKTKTFGELLNETESLVGELRIILEDKQCRDISISLLENVTLVCEQKNIACKKIEELTKEKQND
jgi:hypothetical protein